MNLWKVHQSWRILPVRDVICNRNPPSSSHRIVRNASLQSDKYSSQKQQNTLSQIPKNIANTKYTIWSQISSATVIRRHHHTRSWVLHPACRLLFGSSAARAPSFVGKSKSKFQDRKYKVYLNVDVWYKTPQKWYFQNTKFKGLKRRMIIRNPKTMISGVREVSVCFEKAPAARGNI